MASDAYHESFDLLTEETRDMHRAIVSLKEELEAIDWYQQRADTCSDPQLKDVLLHNKNEEIEHATMLMEWTRPGQGLPLPDRVVRLPRAGARRGCVPQAEAGQEVASHPGLITGAPAR